MTASGLFPAFLIATTVNAVIAIAQYLPSGTATVLIRAPSPAVAAMLAARSGADLVAVPAAGFAVLRGNTARIRASAGPIVLWQGTAPCSNRHLT